MHKPLNSEVATAAGIADGCRFTYSGRLKGIYPAKRQIVVKAHQHVDLLAISGDEITPVLIFHMYGHLI